MNLPIDNASATSTPFFNLPLILWSIGFRVAANASFNVGSNASPMFDVDDISTAEGMMKHGMNVMEKSHKSLVRTIRTIDETRQIGIDVNQRLEQQTNQIENMYDNLESIDSTFGRSMKVIKRMGRKMATDKYIWVVITLVLGTIFFIIIAQKQNLFNKSNHNFNTNSTSIYP